MSRPHKQEYISNVQFRWSADVFEGDPNDVYELAALEKVFLTKLLEDTAAELGEDGRVKITMLEPVLEGP